MKHRKYKVRKTEEPRKIYEKAPRVVEDPCCGASDSDMLRRNELDQIWIKARQDERRYFIPKMNTLLNAHTIMVQTLGEILHQFNG